MKIQPRFTYDSVQFDKENEVHLVVSLTAPVQDLDKKRAPICIIPTIDLSGSMRGEKLAFAKKSAIKLIEQLQPGDYAGLVTFSDAGRVDYHPVEMTQNRKEEIKLKIGQLQTEGGTNLCDGMMRAVDVAKNLDLSASVITRVILLTDGQATHGIALDAKGLVPLLGKIKGHVTLSAFGYGHGADQALLGGLASEGAGNYAFIENPDEALAAFGKELGGLLSTYAQNIEVVINNANGHVISEVLSDADVDEEVDGEITIKIPAILAEETNNIVLAVKLAGQKQHGPRAVNAFDVKVTYQTLDETGLPVKKTEEAKAKIQFVRPEDIQKVPTKEVDEMVARAQLVKVQLEAEKAAERGDFRRANSAIMDFAAEAKSRGHVGVAGVTRHVAANYSDQGTYLRRAGNRMALQSATSRGMGTSGLSSEDADVLLGASYSISNSSQESTSQAFTGAIVNNTVSPLIVPNPVDLGGFDLASRANPILVVPSAWGVQVPAEDPPLVLAEVPKMPTKSAKKLSKSKSKRW